MPTDSLTQSLLLPELLLLNLHFPSHTNLVEPHPEKTSAEPVSGIKKRSRTTERYRKSLLWACATFSDLKTVRHAYRCSAGFLSNNLYAELERRQRTRRRTWPAVIGIDKHYFRRNK